MKSKNFRSIKNGITMIFMLMLSLLNQELKAQETIQPSDSCIAENPASPTSSYNLSSLVGISGIQWSTAGDITIVGSSTGGTVTVKSQSTNINHAPYGKGRLYVSFANDTFPSICGPRIIYKDLYKTFNDSDNIVGPSCVKTGDTVTYSINPKVSQNLDAEIGIDRYKWIIPSSWTSNILYYSADSSSITFKVGTTTGHDSLIVGVGQCNFDNGNYTDTLVLGLSIPPPILSYPSCLPANSKTVTVKWTNPPTGTYTYVWSKPPTWGIVSSSKDSIVLSVDNNPGTVSLRVINDCQTVDSSAVINRSLGSNSTISGSTCVPASSQQSYTATNIPVNTPLQWTIPTNKGWSFATTDTTAQTILVNVGTISADTIFVSAQSCNTVIDTLVVNLSPGNPTILNGDTCIAAGYTDSLTYTVNHVNNATGYGWIFPSGWSPATRTTTDTTVKVKPNGSTGGLVQVYAIGCANSDTISLNVNFGPTKPDSIIAPTCINSGVSDTVTFSIHNIVGGQMYNWKVPSTWSILSASSDSTSISVITDGVNGTYYVKARGINSCDSTAYDSVKVVIQGLTFTVSVAPSRSTTYFEVDPYPVVGGDYFAWYINGTLYSEGSGIDNSDITVLNTALTYPVCVDVTNSSTGCITQLCVDGPGGRPAIEEKALSNGTINTIKVYPNPAQNTLNIEFNNGSTRYVRLLNSEGKVVLFKSIAGSTSTTLDVSSVPAGTYLLMTYSTSSGLTNTTVVISK